MVRVSSPELKERCLLHRLLVLEFVFPSSSLPLFYHLVDPQAIFKLIPKDEQENLPAEENTPEKRADKLWSFFDKKDNGNIVFLC